MEIGTKVDDNEHVIFGKVALAKHEALGHRPKIDYRQGQ
jgi:hypothetical protein